MLNHLNLNGIPEGPTVWWCMCVCQLERLQVQKINTNQLLSTNIQINNYIFGTAGNCIITECWKLQHVISWKYQKVKEKLLGITLCIYRNCGQLNRGSIASVAPPVSCTKSFRSWRMTCESGRHQRQWRRQPQPQSQHQQRVNSHAKWIVM